MQTIDDVGEFGLIRRISHDFLYRPELVALPAGDDAAVYHIPSGYEELISTDTMVEGLHFTAKTMGPADVGWKLCAANCSDMAAMGGEPVGFVISAALPGNLPVKWVEDCYEGLRACCREYKVNLLGGDVTGTTKGILLTGTVVGMVPAGHAVTRGGAQPGDVVFATETLGDSAAGLAAILAELGNEFPALVTHHRRPRPQVALGRILREAGATSLNDISDGLSREANEIAAASGVTIELDAARIPLSEDARRLGETLGRDPLLWALDGGEDYELVGTMPPDAFKGLPAGLAVTAIGRVTEQSGGLVYIEDAAGRHRLAAHGYDHFA